MPRVVVLFGLCTLLASCTTSARYMRIGEPQRARSDDCAIEFFRGENPRRDFVRIARLDVHKEWAGWVQPTLDDVEPELRRQACRAGADAVIEIEQLTSRHLETRRLHVIATGIKWRVAP